MKLIESKAEYISQESGIEGIYKMIELAGRTAYNSQDKITPTSAKGFVGRMIKSHHYAALEHGTVYLHLQINPLNCTKSFDYPSAKFTATYNWSDVVGHIRAKYSSNPYSKVIFKSVGTKDASVYDYYITSNYRVIIENGWQDDLQFLCSYTEFHEKRYTMRFTCSRAIANELIRHRTFSFLQESQRYINYSKERHGGEITFIIPSWFGKAKECSYSTMIEDIEFLDSLGFEGEIRDRAAWLTSGFMNGELCYFKALEAGATPQQARDVLPNATKTELIMTGFSSDWRFLMDLRLFEKTGKVHPDMKNLVQKAQKAMQEAGIWDDIMSKPSKFD